MATHSHSHLGVSVSLLQCQSRVHVHVLAASKMPTCHEACSLSLSLSRPLCPSASAAGGETNWQMEHDAEVVGILDRALISRHFRYVYAM